MPGKSKDTIIQTAGFKYTDYPKWLIPLFSLTPSWVVQVMNLIQPEDVVDADDHHEMEKFFLQLGMEYGDVYSIEIPKPDS